MGEAEVQLHSYLTLAPAVSGQLRVPAILSPGKKPTLPIILEAVRIPHPVWKRATILPLPGTDLRFVTCATSHHITCAILPPLLSGIKLNCAKKHLKKLQVKIKY
jgi:hypothetical protein